MSFLVVLIFLLSAISFYFKRKFQYWKRRNFPYLPPAFPFGNLENPVNRTKFPGLVLRDLYRTAKSRGWNHIGIYNFLGSPTYLPVHLDYVKNIFRDFHHFSSRGFYFNEKEDPLSANLFVFEGERWRSVRAKISAAFSSRRIKSATSVMLKCAESTLELLDSDHGVDIAEVVARYNTDVIGSCVFGLDLSAVKDENSTFRKYGRNFFPKSFSKWRIARRTFVNHYPELASRIGMKNLPKNLEEFFIGLVGKTIKYREENNVIVDDYLQQLIEMRNGEDGFTVEEIAAQCFVFFVAGFDTSSLIVSYALYELSKHKEIQDKAREEITKQDKITYEDLQEMKFLNKIIEETQRLYTVTGQLMRKCTKDYQIPGEDLIIEKGTNVVVSLFGIHSDEEYYPNPEEFNPENFSEEAVNSRHNFSYIPFGEGPRNCVGLRFGLMQTKIILVLLLRKYKFKVNERTREPFEFEADAFHRVPKGGIWLDAQKL